MLLLGATLWQLTLGEVTKQSEHSVSIIIGQAMSRNRFEETKRNMAPTDSPLASWHDLVPALDHHRDNRCLGPDRHDDRPLLVRQKSAIRTARAFNADGPRLAASQPRRRSFDGPLRLLLPLPHDYDVSQEHACPADKRHGGVLHIGDLVNRREHLQSDDLRETRLVEPHIEIRP